MTLRTSCGGIGIHDAKETIPCAYSSSLYNFIRNSDFKSYISSHYLNINPSNRLKIFSSFLNQLSIIQLTKPPDPGEELDFTAIFRLIDALAKKLKRGETIQNVFHYIIVKRRLEAIELTLKSDDNETSKVESQAKYVWIKSLQTKEGSLFLSTIPKCKEYKISSSQLMIILRYRYLIPITSYVLNTSNPVHCTCKNGTTVLDQQGIHIISLCGTDGAPSLIHDKIVRTLDQFIRYAGYRSTVEPTHSFSLFSNDTNERPDILVQSFTSCQEKTYLDVSLTSPISSDINGKLILRSHSTPASLSNKAHAATERFKSKQKKYKKFIDGAYQQDVTAGNFNSTYKAIPIIFQTTGLIHSEAQSYISDLAELASKNTSIPKENMKTYFLKRLNVCLVTSIADAMLSKFHKIATTSASDAYAENALNSNFNAALTVARDEDFSVLYKN